MKKCGPDRRVDLVPEGEVLLQAVKDGLGMGEGGAFDQIPSRCENLGDLRGPFFHFSPCKGGYQYTKRKADRSVNTPKDCLYSTN